MKRDTIVCWSLVACVFLLYVISLIVYPVDERPDYKTVIETTEEATTEEETTDIPETTTVEETTTEEETTVVETIVVDIPTTEETTIEETATEEETTVVETETETDIPETTVEETSAPEPEQPVITDPAYVRYFTPEEEELLVRVAYAETRSSGPEGMALVMNVILNRCAYCGASIHDIVYSPDQFQVLDIMWDLTPTADAYQALALVKSGWDASQGALYFCSPSHNGWHSRTRTYLFTYMGTEYYR